MYRSEVAASRERLNRRWHRPQNRGGTRLGRGDVLVYAVEDDEAPRANAAAARAVAREDVRRVPCEAPERAFALAKDDRFEVAVRRLHLFR